MTDYRPLIKKLAVDRSVLLGDVQVARQIAQRAAQIDPEGDFEVVEDELIVNGLRRRVAVVVNNAADATRSEFGQAGAGKTGRSGLRPLGRATRSVRG